MEFDALASSRRGAPALLALTVLASLGFAAYLWWQPSGVGKDEDPRRVHLLCDEELQEGCSDEVAALLRDSGFEVSVASTVSADQSTGIARDQRAPQVAVSGNDSAPPQAQPRKDSPAAAGRDITAALREADELGVGFLVVQRPRREEIKGLQAEGLREETVEGKRWLVLSVGDFASPRHATVDEAGSEVARDIAGLELLAALYRQPRLAPDRELYVHRPSLEEIQLQHSISPGLAMLENVRRAADTARGVSHGVLDAASAGLGLPLSDPSHSGSALVLSDGTLLLAFQRVALTSDSHGRLHKRVEETLRLECIGLNEPQNRDETPRPAWSTPALQLAESGGIELSRKPLIRSSQSGRIILSWDEVGKTRIFRHEDRCNFSQLGDPIVRSGNYGTPSERGHVAWSAVSPLDGDALLWVDRLSTSFRAQGVEKEATPAALAGQSAPRADAAELPSVTSPTHTTQPRTPAEAGRHTTSSVENEVSDPSQVQGQAAAASAVEVPASAERGEVWESLPLARIGASAAGSPTWMSDGLFAVSVRSFDEEGMAIQDIFVLATDYPGVALRLDSENFLGGRPLRQIAAVADDELLAVVGSDADLIVAYRFRESPRLMLENLALLHGDQAAQDQPNSATETPRGEGTVEVGSGGAALTTSPSSAPPLTDASALAGGEARAVDAGGERRGDTEAMRLDATLAFVATFPETHIRLVEPDEVELEVLQLPGRAQDPVVSPDGTRVVLGISVAGKASNLAVLSLFGAPVLELILQWESDDFRPRWLADNSTLVYSSRVGLGVGEDLVSIPKIFRLANERGE